MAEPLIELLKVLVTCAAAMATASVIIYTWVWSKTNPKNWTVTGITALLWSFMIMSWTMRYIMTVREEPISDSITMVVLVVTANILAGYTLFLYGTWNSGPLRKVRR